MARKATGQVLLRERGDGTKVWALRFSAYGKRHRETLGTAEAFDTRPAGFEPATSASGGQRSIH